MPERLKLGFALRLCLLAVGIAIGCGPGARADQIVLIIDSHGHKVFVNTNDPAPTSKAWKSHGIGYTPAHHSPHIDQLIEQAAREHHLDPKLVNAVIQVESDYDRQAVSDKGAQGLMQLIPSTARRFGVADPFDPRQNIEGGTSYLEYLLNLFGGNIDKALAAYNAGENSVRESGGIPPYQETQRYVHKVTVLYNPDKSQPGSKPSPPPPAPIREYVDEHGVVHFTNVD